MKEFKGKIDSIAPEKLIKKDESDDFDNFFLALGLIYNDLKDLIFFIDLIQKNYRNPTPDGNESPNAHLGEWGGIQIHLNRLVISLISEFLTFIDKNQNITKNIKFQLLIKNLPSDIKNECLKLFNIDTKNSKDFLSKIYQVRSNVTYHYDHSLKNLRKGFIQKFFNSEKDIYNKKSFYSLGNSMETTRFYYCDAAAEEYMKIIMNVKNNDNSFPKIRELISEMNEIIKFMMDLYIKNKQQ